MKGLKVHQWVVVGLISMSFGCGVRLFNGDLFGGGRGTASTDNGGSSSALFKSYAPHYASGQQGELMAVASPTTGCRSNAGRPCVRARASVGIPYQFDQNTAADRSPDSGGGGGAGPVTTEAGAGKTRVTGGPRAPDLPRMENRDLHIMKRQAAPGEHVF